MLSDIAAWVGVAVGGVIVFLGGVYALLVVGCRRSVDFHYGSDERPARVAASASGRTSVVPTVRVGAG